MIERIQQIMQQSTAISTHDGHFVSIVALVRLLSSADCGSQCPLRIFSQLLDESLSSNPQCRNVFHHVVHFLQADWPVDVKAVSGVMLPLARAW